MNRKLFNDTIKKSMFIRSLFHEITEEEKIEHEKVKESWPEMIKEGWKSNSLEYMMMKVDMRKERTRKEFGL